MRVGRKNIARQVGIEGIALHSGVYTRMELRPVASGSGIHFVRTDLGGLRVPALQASTTALEHATSVGRDDVAIGTVEHVLAAVWALGITDLDIAIDGCEIPIIDGSAIPFVHLIEAAGITEFGEDLGVLRITRPIEVRDGDRWIRIEPADHLSIHYRIDFAHKAVGRQTFRYDFNTDSFIRRIAPARTFGFLRDVERLRAAGLARGGSVENCIVIGEEAVTNGPLRYRDEFVRHKVLDLIGDFALLGRPIVGAVTASKGGHALHAKLVAEILDSPDAWVCDDEAILLPAMSGVEELAWSGSEA
jgi:UDP-3-O-[3-hydroxymyristoyl] N-acetylglucosamine deacetylase